MNNRKMNKAYQTFFASILTVFSIASFSIKAEVIESNSFQYEIAPTPAWVDMRSKRSYEVDAGFGINYQLLDSQFLVQGDTRQSYRRTVHTISSEQGLQDGARLEVSFSPDFQSLIFHDITITRNGKTQSIINTADIRLIQPESELNMGLITGQVTALVLLSDVRVGDQIDYSFTIDGVNTIFGDKAFAGYTTTWQVPVNDSYISVQSDQTMQYRMENTPGEILITQMDNGLTRYDWTYQNVPEVAGEDNYPYWHNPYGVIEFTSYQTWAEVVNWATELFPYSDELSPQIHAKNQEWLDSSKTKKDYINKVIEFAQNDIRYLGLELGQNSHKPHSPIEVFDRRFGDCKDKALLIAALLQDAGIEAHAALISTNQRKKLLDVLPSPGQFNHVVTRFIYDGKEYWIDGTKSFQLTELDNKSINNFQYGLLIKDEETNLVPVTPPTKHVRDVTLNERFDYSDNTNDVKVEIDVVYTGAEAERMREYIASAGMKVFQSELYNYYLRTYPTLIENGDLTKSDSYVDNQLTFSSAFLMPNPFISAEEDIIFPLYGTNVSSYVELPAVKERKMPMALYEGFTSEHNIDIKLPFAIGWELEDKEMTIEDSGITYQRSIVAEPSNISVSHKYATKSDHIATAETKEHIANIREIRDALYYSVSVPNKSNSVTKSLQQRLREALGKN
jgi:hypothetical protein